MKTQRPTLINRPVLLQDTQYTPFVFVNPKYFKEVENSVNVGSVKLGLTEGQHPESAYSNRGSRATCRTDATSKWSQQI